MPEHFRGQNYSTLKKECLKKGVLFEDIEFPATSKSLFFSKVASDVEWKRPKELCKVPKLVVEGVSCDDLNPGELGYQFFITACSTLANEPKLFAKVVPNYKDQEWNDEKPTYAGIFHFQIWRFNQWLDVVVDDRLPTRENRLLFCHSNTRNEFWSALLEKAYAKLYGDYESLGNCTILDVLVDLTGGVAEKLILSEINTADKTVYDEIFSMLLSVWDNRALIVCSIQCPPEETGKETEYSLLKGHGYNVTGVLNPALPKSIQGALEVRSLPMMRLFNPFGKVVWSGPYSATSREYKAVAISEWEKIGVKFKHEGEFWMHFDDVLKNFTHIDICHFVNTSFFSLKKTWSEAILHSEWNSAGMNGGGDFKSASFLSNPQFIFDITGNTDKIMVSLEQHDIRHGQAVGKDIQEIGFQILRVEENRKFRVHLQNPSDLKYCSVYRMTRSVFGRTLLVRGRYVIVATTKKPGKTAMFMLRLYTTNSSSARELTQDCPTVNCPCVANYALVSVVTVVSATGLELPPGSKGKFEPYVIIKAEGESVRSPYVTNTETPNFKFRVIFYRKQPAKIPITIEVWNHNTVMDSFIAQAKLVETGMEEEEDFDLDLFGRGKEVTVEKPGKVKVRIQSSTDLSYL